MNNGVTRKASAQGDVGQRKGTGVGFDRVGPRGYPPGLPQWNADALRAAWARQAGGGDPLTILCVGDSVTEGTGASDWVNRWSEVMRSYIQARTGVNTGSGVVPAHMSQRGFSQDSRWRYSPTDRTKWSNSGVGGYFGGTIWNSPATGAEELTFEPQTPVDGFTMWWTQTAASNGTWSAKIDGVSVGGPYATTQGEGIYSQTFRASSRGLHTFTFSAEAATTRAYLLGVDGFVDTQGGVKVLTDGVWSSLMNVTWDNGTQYALRRQVAANKVDCMIWGFGLNHRIQNQTLASFRSQFDIVGTYQANAAYRPASVILMVPPPPQAGGTANGLGLYWDQYAQVIREAAARYNWGLIDVTAAWGTYANKPANYIDDVHPTDAGYAEMGQLAADAVLGAVGQRRPSTPASLRSGGLGYLLLGGNTSQYVESADSAALDITGEIDIAIRVDPNTWGTQALLSKWSATTADKSYELWLNSGGWQIFTHNDGSDRYTQAATGVGFVASTGPRWLRWRRTVDGVCRFYTAADSVDLPSSWTTVATISGLAASLKSGAGPLWIGRGYTVGQVGGKYYRVQIWSGDSQAGGTLAFDARFDLVSAGVSTFTESSTNAATVNIIGTTL